ncbi:autotransporter domain-containing protein [Enterovirga sp. GCM10030262]|uniref:autotransporter outer membrane beta-barrel domain-containing protein n=1 Tax=Enterovirga sp. GCM10030262 TaxID=3273391 RepID=UPI0036094D25
MRRLLAATCLTPVALAAAVAPLRAETVINSAQTAPVRTSTIASGQPDDIRIVASGSVKPNGGAAVTLDSDNDARNEGTVQISGASGATGVLAEAGVDGSIVNTGTIILDENYTATDADKDGDLDGPFAQGSGRFGIRTGALAGNVINNGTITVEGNQSAGIAIDGPLGGALASSVKVSVTGDNSVGIRAGDVAGNVRVTGLVEVKGANSVGVALDGDIGGSLVVQGGITSTGYRSITAPADPKKLDADDLLQGGSALTVAGNVAGGILFDAPPPDRDEDEDDEDDDGVEDAKESRAVIMTYGAAPAVRIGAAEDIAIGAVAGEAAGGHGIVINGDVRAFGVYQGVSATALSIGGLGGRVTVAGGLAVNGSVTADSRGGDATAIRLGDGADVETVRIAGKVTAVGGKAGTSRVEAIAIDEGADVGTIRNSGQIAATLTGAGGKATAIVDRSGTVSLVENKGGISAGGGKDADRAIALDLRANRDGVTVRQTAVAEGAAAPSITGAILFGSGDDLLDIADGKVVGNIRFGGGSNRLALSGDALHAGNVAFGAGADSLALGGSSRLTGNVDFGGGADSLTLGGTSIFSGTLAGSGGLAVTLAGGSLDVANKGAVSLGSLDVSGGGSLTVSIDTGAGTNTLYDVAGDASFGTGSKVNVKLDSISDGEGSYVIVRAGSLEGGSNLTTAGAVLPFLYASSIAADDAAGEVALNIRRKSAAELGLNRSQGGAYDAIVANLDSDALMADVFLAIQDGDTFRSSLRQLLPEHAGGTFETVTQASRATARFLADPRSPMVDMGGWGFFLQQVAWGSSKGLGDTSSYDINGWGASGGAELQAGGVGNFGVSLAYLLGKDADGGTDNEVNTRQAEIAAYWRNNWDALQAFARVSAAHVDFEGLRRFTGSTGTETVTRESRGDWSGTLVSAAAGLSYELRFGRLAVRPAASIDYYRLKEDGYTESGGGTAMDLVVDSRSGDETAANATVAIGYDIMGGAEVGEGFFRAEIEGGRRQLIGGSLGATTARFEGGEDFTLLGTERESGWVGKFRLLGGNDSFLIGGEVNAEEQQGRAAVAFRASLQLGF